MLETVCTRLRGFYQFYPCNVTIVGVMTGDQVNFMAAAWHSALSFDPLLFGVAISPQRHTHGMITQSGEFTCNFLTMEHLELMHGTGNLSGRDGDKCRALNIPLTKSEVIETPVITSSYAAYECRVYEVYPVGDHDFFVGEIVAVHEENGITTADGMLDPGKLDFSLYIGKNTYLPADGKKMKVMDQEVCFPAP